MKHLIVCPEYPAAEYAGGIGTYVHHISRMLTEAGDTVHVIALRWKGARSRKQQMHDRLIIHRVGELPLQWRLLEAPHFQTKELSGLRDSSFPPQAFSYQASLLAEKLIEQEKIDLIEGQEFEAPLYYLLLRRALGLGPKRQPPCIVHLHSPMEFIVRNNEWDINHPYFHTAKRLEDYCIRAADARLCPSRYLARQAQSHYGLPEGAIQVIPLPVNTGNQISRSPETWEKGSILYVGRLERRKGILEWIQAAVAAAGEDSRLTFDFVGANCLSADHLSGEEIISRMVPSPLKKQFHFHGQQKQADLLRFFSTARLAVVPSRWENFPNTCLEAMCTGLPVLSTREGGMVEIIDDGQTGWLADSADAKRLYRALQRALHTSAGELAQMGAAAFSAVRRKCDNKRVLEEHLQFRRRVFEKGATQSPLLPEQPHAGASALQSKIVHRNTGAKRLSDGLAVVITCCNAGRHLEKCLESLRRQTRTPVASVIVDDNSTDAETIRILQSKEKDGWKILNMSHGENIEGNNLAIAHILDSGIHPAGFSFLRAEDRLAPGFIEICSSVLDRCSQVGLVSGWVECMGRRKGILVNPCPGFPFQWAINEIAPFAAVRTEALMEAGLFRSGMDGEFAYWDLFNAVLAANWTGVTVPCLSGSCRFKEKTCSGSTLTIRRGMRKAMLTRFPEMIAADAANIIMMTEAQSALALQQQYWSLKSRLSRTFDTLISSRFLRPVKNRRRNG